MQNSSLTSHKPTASQTFLSRFYVHISNTHFHSPPQIITIIITVIIIDVVRRLNELSWPHFLLSSPSVRLRDLPLLYTHEKNMKQMKIVCMNDGALLFSHSALVWKHVLRMVEYIWVFFSHFRENILIFGSDNGLSMLQAHRNISDRDKKRKKIFFERFFYTEMMRRKRSIEIYLLA